MLNMQDFLFNASNGSNIFNTKKLYSELSPKSAKMLENIGYLQETEVSKIMRLDKMLNRRYWNKQLKK